MGVSMLLRDAIEKHLKDVRREEGLGEERCEAKLSVLRSFHKTILGLNTGQHAKEPDGQLSHNVYMSMTDSVRTEDLTKEDFLNFVDVCRTRLSKASQKANFVHVNVFADWLLDEELTGKALKTNPMRRVKNPLAGQSVDKSREPRKRYDAKIVRHILLVTLERFGMFKYFFMALFFLLGRRVSEVALMQWKHVNWESRVLTYYDEKTDSWKESPIHSDLFTMLKAYRQWYQEHCDSQFLGKIGGHGDWYIFPALQYYGDVKLKSKRPFRLIPSKNVHKQTYTNWFNECLAEAGQKVKGQATHTAKHHQVNQQVDTFQKKNVGDATKLVTQYSGHARVETMEQHYRNKSKDMERYQEVIDQIEIYGDDFRDGLPGFEEHDGPRDKGEREQILLESEEKAAELTPEEEEHLAKVIYPKFGAAS